MNKGGERGEGVRDGTRERVVRKRNVSEGNEISKRVREKAMEGVGGEIEGFERGEEGEGGGDVALELIGGKVNVREVKRVPMVREDGGEVGVRKSEGNKMGHVRSDDGNAGAGDGDVEDGKVREVVETGEEEGGEVVERGGAGEGVEREGEGGREETRGGERAVGEGEGGEGGERAEGGDGEVGEVGRAVGKVEGEKVAERTGRVAGGGVVVRGRVGAGVESGGKAESVKSA